MVRSGTMGCFAGNLQEHDRVAKHVVLKNARRLWYWRGAASLSQLAMEGVKDPAGCKFPCETLEHEIGGVEEVIATTPEAEANIKAVPVWKL